MVRGLLSEGRAASARTDGQAKSLGEWLRARLSTSRRPARRSDGHYQPLAGVEVLDLTAVIMGPFGTQILADMGAEVTVVETPVGDANRHMGKGPHPDVSGVTLNLMRNKEHCARPAQ